MQEILYTPTHIKDPRNHYRKIYFSSHPEDMVLFDKIAADIREIEKDCVIAHISDYEQPINDRIFAELKEFHLIVIPITEKWLSCENEEYAFFIQNNKAIIPILMDESLEEAYNERTNKRQYLCINDDDYKQKLRKNLEEILFDASLLDDVRAVFTHKLFVSYCHEDLDSAQELIRRVHAEETGRRVAVWYDKYLPAGKNFEDSIFKELDACNFFGITVTPNILARENYVKSDRSHVVL